MQWLLKENKDLKPETESQMTTPSRSMKALFACHCDPLCNTEDNYFMNYLMIRRRKHILCVVGLWLGRFSELFSLFIVSCRILIKIESHLQHKDKDASNPSDSSESTGKN